MTGDKVHRKPIKSIGNKNEGIIVMNEKRKHFDDEQRKGETLGALRKVIRG